MRCFWSILFSCITASVSGQNLDSLKTDLHHTIITEVDTIREKAKRILQIDPYEEWTIYFLAMSYRESKLSDSIPALFNWLKRLDTNRVEPYLYSAKYQFEEFSSSDTSRLAELMIASTLDSNNAETQFLFGVSYYILFHERPNAYYASSCRMHLLKAMGLESTYIPKFKHVVIQMSTFLGETSFPAILSKPELVDKLNKPKKGAFYFPIDSFMTLKDHWESDYSFDVGDEADKAAFKLSWYSDQLYALEEPLVFNQPVKHQYRFTWIRSFDRPVAIRMEKTKKGYILYWKQTDGAGGYNPGKLIVSKSKPLTKEQWDNAVKLLEKASFWAMPTEEEDWGNDGAQWIIEGMENGRYHVVDRFTPSDNSYQQAGLYLLGLTDLNIPEKDVY